MRKKEYPAGWQPSTMEDKLAEQMHGANRFIRNHTGPRSGQRKILRWLSVTGSMPQQELQERLKLKSSSISEILPKLESAGLLTRHRDEADKRHSIVTITEAGRAQAAKDRDNREHQLLRIFGVLSKEEQQQLLTMLETLNERWETLDDTLEDEQK